MRTTVKYWRIDNCRALARQRGATLIIVLGILAVLALVAISLTYTSKLDTLAAGHFGDAVQRRMASVSGLPLSAPMLAGLPQTAKTQPWHQAGRDLGAPEQPPQPAPARGNPQRASMFQPASLTNAGYLSPPPSSSRPPAPPRWGTPPSSNARSPQRLADLEHSPSVVYRIEDLSAKFNLNALGSWNEPEQPTPGVLRLKDALYQALRTEGIDDSALAAKLAQNIIKHKYGPDGKPGVAGFDDDGDGPEQNRLLLTNQRDDDRDLVEDNPEEIFLSPINDGIDQNWDGQIDDENENLETNRIDDNLNGTVDEPGESIDEADEFIPDPRFRPHGDDNPFDAIEELLEVDGVTPEIFAALQKHFTVFSVSRKYVAAPAPPNFGSPGPAGFGPFDALSANPGAPIAGFGRNMPGDHLERTRPFPANPSDRRLFNGIPNKSANPLNSSWPNPGAGRMQDINQGYGAAPGQPSAAAPGLSGLVQINALPINYASAEALIAGIEQIMPGKDPELVRQFVANLIDSRDPDSIPTQLPNPSDPLRPCLGVERTPVINEIYADAATAEADGDDGQFIELYNPYDQSISIQGWTLEWGAGRYALTGSIAAKGYLIVTDDYDGTNDPEREEFPGYGSFYDIFGKVGNTSKRRLIELAWFDLPNAAGAIHLWDHERRLIDYVIYENSIFDGASRSLQRAEPRLRHLQKLPPTPFDTNANFFLPGLAEDDPFHNDPHRDRPFTSAVDAMYVYAGYVDATGTGQPWRLPSIRDDRPGWLDSRLVDLLTVDDRHDFPQTELETPPELAAPNTAATRPLAASALNESAPAPIASTLVLTDPNDENGPEAQFDLDPLSMARLRREITNPARYGRLNINTCSATTLRALPHMTAAHVQRIMAYRKNCEAASQSLPPGAAIVPFSMVGDLLRLDGIWDGADDETRLGLFTYWAPCLTVNSQSFTVEYGPRLTAEESELNLRPLKLRSTVAFDGRSPRIVNSRAVR